VSTFYDVALTIDDTVEWSEDSYPTVIEAIIFGLEWMRDRRQGGDPVKHIHIARMKYKSGDQVSSKVIWTADIPLEKGA
jgi:hypothetical protein